MLVPFMLVFMPFKGVYALQGVYAFQGYSSVLPKICNLKSRFFTGNTCGASANDNGKRF